MFEAIFSMRMADFLTEMWSGGIDPCSPVRRVLDETKPVTIHADGLAVHNGEAFGRVSHNAFKTLGLDVSKHWATAVLTKK